MIDIKNQDNTKESRQKSKQQTNKSATISQRCFVRYLTSGTAMEVYAEYIARELSNLFLSVLFFFMGISDARLRREKTLGNSTYLSPSLCLSFFFFLLPLCLVIIIIIIIVIIIIIIIISSSSSVLFFTAVPIPRLTRECVRACACVRACVRGCVLVCVSLSLSFETVFYTMR